MLGRSGRKGIVRSMLVCCCCLMFFISQQVLAASIELTNEQRLKMGEKANRLVHEKSPYLLQHAFNPVDWYPWGEEALNRAMKENKPVFLSIGYSTCHWCHVMEEESFENPEIAAYLNKWFISIKVDREERPDIDSMYMAATLAITGSGGWPMSVFLFPDGRPIYAGTYFPPQTKYGRTGFLPLLKSINDAWQNKKDQLDSAADVFVKALVDSNRKADDSSLESGVFDKCYVSLENDFDTQNGGFGNKPKFPRPVIFNFLFRYWYRTQKEPAAKMVLQTLQNMARGGMYDQIGGGFHRYSVDENWFVPHFEKMLYDQSQLLRSYLEGYQITGHRQYFTTAKEIVSYILRDMQGPAGGFYSAEDADSQDPYILGRKGEGAYYLWTKNEVEKILGFQADKIFSYCYGLEKKGNVVDDPQNEFVGKNILHLVKTAKQAAEKFKTDVSSIEKSLENSRAILLAARIKRSRPYRDDKIITAWNGLMISSLAKAAAVLNDSEAADAAIKAASFIWENLYDADQGTLKRRYRQGSSGPDGQLEDYAFLVAGLIDLYQLDQHPKWLDWAVKLTQVQNRLFWDEKENGFFDSVQDSSVLVRMKESYDGAEPAGNSVAAMNLLHLSLLTGNDYWKEKAVKTIEYFSEQLNSHPSAMAQMLCAWDQYLSKQEQIVIAGKREAADTRKLLEKVHASFSPGRIVLLADGSENQQFLAEKLPFLRDVTMIDGKATAYVCRDFTCNLPVTDPEELEKQLKLESVKW